MKDAAWLVAFGGEELFNTAELFCWKKTTKAYCKLVFGGRCYWEQCFTLYGVTLALRARWRPRLG